MLLRDLVCKIPNSQYMKTLDAPFKEQEHPREKGGENAGQFTSKGGGSASGSKSNNEGNKRIEKQKNVIENINKKMKELEPKIDFSLKERRAFTEKEMTQYIRYQYQWSDLDNYLKKQKENLKALEKNSEADISEKKEEVELPIKLKTEVGINYFVEKGKKVKAFFHGTSQKAWEKIKEQGYLKPQQADDTSVDDAVWFSADPEYSGNIAKNKTVLLAIKEEYLREFRKKNLSVTGKHDGDMVVFSKIPLKYMTVLNEGIK